MFQPKPKSRKRIFNGQAGVLTEDSYLKDQENSKKKQKKSKTPKSKTESARAKLGEITNQQTTAVNLQFCAPYSPFLYHPQFWSSFNTYNNFSNYSTAIPQTAATFPANILSSMQLSASATIPTLGSNSLPMLRPPTDSSPLRNI